MKFQTISVFWLMLIAGLLTYTGNTAAESTDAPPSSSSEKDAISAASDLPDLNSMTTELNNRSVVLKKEIIELSDLSVIQERLARMAKEMKSLSRNLKLISQAIESLTAQRQVAEVIRASQSSLENELDAFGSVLRDNLMRKTARSMFSSKYYSLLKKGFEKELPKSLLRFSMPDVQFFKRWGWLVSIQASFSLILGIGIIQQRHRLIQKEQWQFIARRPIEAGIFVTAIAMSSFYGAIPGTWRLLALCIVIVSLTRLVVAFIGDAYKRNG